MWDYILGIRRTLPSCERPCGLLSRQPERCLRVQGQMAAQASCPDPPVGSAPLALQAPPGEAKGWAGGKVPGSGQPPSPPVLAPRSPQAHRVRGLGGDFQELLLGSSLRLAGLLQVLLQLIGLLGPAGGGGAVTPQKVRKWIPSPPFPLGRRDGVNPEDGTRSDRQGGGSGGGGHRHETRTSKPRTPFPGTVYFNWRI